MKLRIRCMVSIAAAFLACSVHAFGADAQVPQEMVLIPAGTFLMGSPIGPQGSGLTEPGRVANEAQHSVRLRALYLAPFEVTKAEWETVREWATSHGYSDLPFGKIGGYDYELVALLETAEELRQHPITGISWYDAVKWCNAKSEKEGRTSAYTVGGITYRSGEIDYNGLICDWSSDGYRLPTEAEWEYACRAGTTTAFSSGPILFTSLSDPNLNLVGWYIGNSGWASEHPAGLKESNAWGLYDMHGNVGEWCWDWYALYPASAVVDPMGPGTWQEAIVPRRIIRGGGWRSLPKECRAAYRGYMLPETRTMDVGFRLARSTPPSAEEAALKVIAAPPPPFSYSAPPRKMGELLGDSLVVITHGWQPSLAPVDVGWVDEMANVLRQEFSARGLTRWRVYPYLWVKKAHQFSPETALTNAKGEGTFLGTFLTLDRWNHIHLIAHSAGAGLIQAACDVLKGKGDAPNTVVHLTFLDPFIGFSREGVEWYGKGADWADSYFSVDSATFDELVAFTRGPIQNAYSVDVTFLDPHKEAFAMYVSTPASMALKSCFQTVSSHRWPVQFYLNTILGEEPNAEGFGFPLSKEGGNWETALGQYPKGNALLRVLGTPDVPCSFPVNETTAAYAPPLPNLDALPRFMSPTGAAEVQRTQVVLTPGSPAWVVLEVPLTNAVDLLSFEAAFSGVYFQYIKLSVYWETNVVGVLQSSAKEEFRHYSFSLPKARKEAAMLGFRVDLLSSGPLSPLPRVILTNIALGRVGTHEPFSLSFAGSAGMGVPLLELRGEAGFNYLLQSSTNLMDWKTLAVLVNTNGAVRFSDPSFTSAVRRFYRAVVP